MGCESQDLHRQKRASLVLLISSGPIHNPKQGGRGVGATASIRCHPASPILGLGGSHRSCYEERRSYQYLRRLQDHRQSSREDLFPRIEELFTSLAHGKAFTKLDLSHAYLQIPLDKESCQFVTINTHKGLFECKHLPFGAPSIFYGKSD